eukprot:scaffold58371_cov19-Tisochrysis_lutea.AAC.1
MARELPPFRGPDPGPTDRSLSEKSSPTDIMASLIPLESWSSKYAGSSVLLRDSRRGSTDFNVSFVAASVSVKERKNE